MPSIAVALAELPASVRRPGDFIVSGGIDLMASLLEVEVVGPIGLPLMPMQAKQLIAAAKRAPYGHGSET